MAIIDSIMNSFGAFTNTSREAPTVSDPQDATQTNFNSHVNMPQEAPHEQLKSNKSCEEDEEENGTNSSSVTPSSQSSGFHEDSIMLAGEELRLQMKDEKGMYPGASSWAKPEEELFELLYQRQDLPLLPSYWSMDFRGMPMSENVFDTSDERPPVIYANSDKEFHGTDALTRLIDLTADVRTTVQSGLRRKAPKIIKKGLEDFIAWAARDGGYSHLKYVPNITVAIVPREMHHESIDGFIQARLRSLGQLQREFLRHDRSPNFWKTVAASFLGSRIAFEESFGERLSPFPATPPKRPLRPTSESTGNRESETTSRESSFERPTKRLRQHSPSDSDAEAEDDDGRVNRFGRLAPRTPTRQPYRRKPPVVYGLFIVGTSVFILTLDSSKGDEAYVSFHIELNFLDSHQGVWNGLTVAIAVCLARDEQIARMNDFETLSAESESDLDA